MPRFRAPLRKALLALVALVVCQVGAYVAAPGVDGRVLAAFFRARRAAGEGRLLALYDLLGGGGVARGAWLALGALPYLTAWCWMRLARAAVPAVRDAAARDDGGRTLRRWTRVLTGVLALVQSLGFSLFVQTVPGAVARPGAGFVLRTMLLLTAGALAVMWLGERITGDADGTDDEEPLEPPTDPIVPHAERPALAPPLADVEALRRPAAGARVR
jgi:preprotein translocase subunit SecY